MNILIVEDNPFNLKLLTAMLEAENINVLSAVNGAEALKMIEHYSIDGIISDILMPVMDGYELCMKIRKDKKFHNIPFVFYTATYTSPSDEKFSLGLGADAFIKKPSPVRELLDAIEKAHAHPLRKIKKENTRSEKRVLREYSERLVAKLEQKNVELEITTDELEKAHDQLKNLFDTLEDVFFSIDAVSNRLLLISPACKKVFGYSQKQFTDDPLLLKRIIYSEDLRKAEKAESALNEGGLVQNIYRIQHAEKGLHWVESKLKATIGSGKKIIRIDGIITDITDRKHAEEIFYESQERFRTVWNKSVDGMRLTNNEGNIIMANPAFCRMVKKAENDLFGNPLNVVENDRFPYKAIENYQKQFLEESFPTLLSTRIELWNEDQMDIDISNSFITVGEGQKLLLSIFRDVTEKKLTEEKYRDIFTWAPVGIYQSTYDGKFLTVNESLARMLGYSREELMEKNIAKDIYLSEKERSRLLEQFEAAGSAVDVEVQWKKKNGIPLWILLTVHTVKDANGKTIYFEGFVHNINERKKTEEKVIESVENYRSLFESARDAIFTISPLGIITNLNAAFEKLTGWSRNEWVGKSFTDLIHRDDQRKAAVNFKESVQGNILPPSEYRLKTKSNEYVFTEITSTAQQQKGLIVGLIGIARDISERRKLEEELRQSQKLESIGTLVGGIAHDFNNILGIISGYISLLQKENGNSEKSLSRYEIITKVVQRGTSLVRQLLTFARKNTASVDLTNINIHISDLSRMLNETFPQNIQIVTKLDTSLQPTYADTNQLYQMFLNICVNARDAMPNGGIITISTEEVPSSSIAKKFIQANSELYIHIAIQDTGMGMSAAVKERIFDPFFTTKDQNTGTGLGLAVAYGVVKRHEGIIHVDSSEGKGTTFHIYLPVVKKDLSIHTNGYTSVIETKGGNETVLIVEDEEWMMAALQLAILEKGYTVLTAADGVEAVEIFQQNKNEIAIVITDLGLPKLSGIDAIKKIKTIQPSVPVILTTGFLDPDKQQEIVDSGIKMIIQKPYSIDEILSNIRNVLDTQLVLQK